MAKKKQYSEHLLQVRITDAMKREMEQFAMTHETDLSDMTRRAIRLMLDMAKAQEGKHGKRNDG